MNFLPVTLLLAIAASTVVQAAPADYPAAQYIAALQAKVAAVTARLNATQWPSSTAAAAGNRLDPPSPAHPGRVGLIGRGEHCESSSSWVTSCTLGQVRRRLLDFT